LIEAGAFLPLCSRDFSIDPVTLLKKPQRTQRQRRQTLREELIEGYKAMADKSLALAQEWESVGNEAWLKHNIL